MASTTPTQQFNPDLGTASPPLRLSSPRSRGSLRAVWLAFRRVTQSRDQVLRVRLVRLVHPSNRTIDRFAGEPCCPGQRWYSTLVAGIPEHPGLGRSVRVDSARGAGYRSSLSSVLKQHIRGVPRAHRSPNTRVIILGSAVVSAGAVSIRG